MYKKIILLTKSRKYKNYCVAGKDIDTGEWVRLISEDDEIHNAIRGKYLIYEDMKEADILDIIGVRVHEIDDANIDLNQPENYILDTGFYLNKLNGEYDLDSMLDCDETIFFNKNNSIHANELINIEDRKSLMLIEAEVMKIRRKNDRALIANICYKSTWYNNLSITDDSFNEAYYNEIPREGSLNFYNIKIVVSLGEKYEVDDRHYKLIASVIE